MILMDKEDIFRMCDEGSIYSKRLEELREMLCILSQVRPGASPLAARLAQCSATIRFLIGLEEARQAQKQTICWARIGLCLLRLELLLV